MPENEKQIAIIPDKFQESRRRGPKRGTSYVPQPQQEAMIAMFLKGKAISVIAEETNRDFKTVAKIVRAASPERHLDECREQSRDLIPVAIEALTSELQKGSGKDRARIAIDLLKYFGVFEKPESLKREARPPSLVVQFVDPPPRETWENPGHVQE